MKRRLILNTASNYALFVLQIAVAFIMTPLYVRYLGLRDYGLWEVVVSIIGYAGMLDLGLWPTISRFVAKYQAERNRGQQEATFATALVFMSVVGLLGALLTVVLLVTLEWDLFFGGGELTTYYRSFLGIVAVSVIIKFPGIVAEAYLEGQQRYALKNLFSIINLVVSTTIIFALIDGSSGLLLLATVSVFASALKYSIFFTLLFVRQPQAFGFQLSACSRAHLGTLLRFGIKSFVQGLSGRITNQSSPLIIAAVANSALVPLFTIPASLVRYATTFLMTSTHAFMPLFTSMAADGETGKIRDIYLVSNRAVVGLGALMLLGIVLVGPAFIAVWISDSVAADSQVILAALAFGALGLALNPFGSRFLTAIDQHGIYARFSPIFAVIGVALSIVLMLRYGLPGLAVGASAPVVVSLPLFVSVMCRHLGISPLTYVASFWAPVVAGSAAALLTWQLIIVPMLAMESFLSILIAAAMMSAAFGVAFLTLDLLGSPGVSVARRFLGRAAGHVASG
ncbi:MAG: oligosaccharide flippase family protein [Pseudomonadota bacterium]